MSDWPSGRKASVTESDSQSMPRRLLREHPALLVSAIYVFATAIGMFFSWSFMRNFGVNIFLYAEIGDFLLASFKDPVIWMAVAAMAFGWYSDDRMSRRWGARERMRGLRWYGTKAYRRWGYSVVLAVLTYVLHILAVAAAEDVRAGYGDVVRVSLADEEQYQSVALLDTTARFVFLFDTDTQMVYVHPHESIAVISFIAPEEEQ